MQSTPRFLPAADAAVVVELGDTVDEAVNARVLALDEAIRRDPPPGVTETVPTLRSLLVLYDPLLTAAGLSPAAAVAAHTGALHRVAMLGHLPGLPYCTGLPAALHSERHPRPRTRVAAGSVAIAGGLTCVYPVAAPGGWRILGRTPALLFDPNASPPAVLAPGDRLRFVAVDATKAAELEGRPPRRGG